MRVKLQLFMLSTLLVGCSTPKLNINTVSTLSNDELCEAMGSYQNDGSAVLKLHNEIMSRGNMDLERCYAIEKANIPKGVVYGITSEPGKVESVYNPEKNRHETRETTGSVGGKIEW